MIKNNNLRMNLKIFDPTDQRTKDGNVLADIKNAKVDSLKDIIKKYFG